MHKMDWSDVWYAHPGKIFKRPYWKVFRRLKNRWHVGVWSGKDNDLICVRHIEDYPTAPTWLDRQKEVEHLLSPGGPTIFLACIFALIRWWRTK